MEKGNLLIINDYGMQGGGTETRIRIFVEELLGRGTYNSIHILQRFDLNPDVNKALQKQHQNLFVHALKKNESGYNKAKEIIKRESITFVQVHNLLRITPRVVLAAKKMNIPVVWWAHDYWLLCANRSFINPFHARTEEFCNKKGIHKCMGWKTKVKYLFWKWCMNKADAAIAPSITLQKIHEKNNVLVGKWATITPWIDPVFFMTSKKEKKKQKKLPKEINEKKGSGPCLLFVSSLVEFKGAWVAVHALKSIVQKFPQTKLVLVGAEQEKESRYRKDIEAIAMKDQTEKNIILLGTRTKEEIALLHKKADVYLCPTVCMESFGLNWAEAMVSGTPVVASNIGGIPDYIKNNDNGVLFPPRDHQMLAKAIMALLSNKKEAKALGRRGQQYAKTHFTSKRATDEIFALYKKREVDGKI